MKKTRQWGKTTHGIVIKRSSTGAQERSRKEMQHEENKYVVTMVYKMNAE
jgi:hypothetical protein